MNFDTPAMNTSDKAEVVATVVGVDEAGHPAGMRVIHVETLTGLGGGFIVTDEPDKVRFRAPIIPGTSTFAVDGEADLEGGGISAWSAEVTMVVTQLGLASVNLVFGVPGPRTV